MLVIAAIASVLVSGVWYFDLIPNIQLVSADQPVSLASPISNPPSIIVVTVVPPKSIRDEQISGFVRVHAPVGYLADSPGALAFREFTVIDQRITPVVFTELPAGQYALSAFFDLNGNGILDVDDQQVPSEPFRLSNLADPSSESLELENASVTLGLGQTLNLRLSFAG